MKVPYGGLLLILLLLAALVSGCVAGKPQEGDTVSINYTLTLDNGTTYFTSKERQPLQYTLGEGQLLPDLEIALAEMEVGESRTVEIPAERAYGPRQPELIATFDRAELPEGARPEVGQQVQMETENGSPIMVAITDVSENTVTIDANHPLAGQNLTFDLELLAIGDNPVPTPRPTQSSFSWFMWALAVLPLGVLFFYLKGRLTSLQDSKRGTLEA